MATDPGDLVLDPTCGSGTTAYVAEQWGRRWITIDTSRVALALARARIMGARYPFYLLADSRDGQLKEAEITRTARPRPDPRQYPPGLCLRTCTAYHAEVHRQQRRDRCDLGAIPGRSWNRLRAQLNAALKKKWEEWEIPRDAGRRMAAAAARSCTPSGGSSASPARRKSTRPSPPRPTSNTCTTSRTRTKRRSVLPGRSRSKVCRPTAR